MNQQQKDALRTAAEFLLRSADARPLPPNPPMPAIERGRQVKADGDMERIRELLSALVRWSRDGGGDIPANAERIAWRLHVVAEYLLGKEGAEAGFSLIYDSFVRSNLIQPF